MAVPDNQPLGFGFMVLPFVGPIIFMAGKGLHAKNAFYTFRPQLIKNFKKRTPMRKNYAAKIIHIILINQI
jgi:hypothetical protein